MKQPGKPEDQNCCTQ